MFSGMRLNEACGLALADFKSESGIDYIHVRDVLEGQSLKSDAARRKVPVHKELVELGLIMWVEKLRATGNMRLFDDLEQDSRGYLSGVPSKFFAHVIARIVDPAPEEPGVLVFHSMRHTVISRLRAADVRMDVAKSILGHEQNETHGGYGKSDVATLKASVDKIVYEGLDLDPCRLPTGRA